MVACAHHSFSGAWRQKNKRGDMRQILYGLLLLTAALWAANPFAPARSGYEPTPADPSEFRVSFWGGAMFDPASENPPLPAGLTLSSYPGDGAGYYLIQFSGPVYSPQIGELRRLGVSLAGFHSRYLALARMNSAQRQAAAGLPFVRWIGIYQPGYKFAASVLKDEGFGRISICLFYASDIEAAQRDLRQIGIKVVRSGVSEDFKMIEVDCARERVAEIARLPDVFSIEEWHPPEPENEQCQWVVQTWSSGNRRIWSQGVFGAGEILGYTDTGLDVNHYAFRDPSVALADTGEFPAHRKVVAFKHYPAAGGVGDPDGHGTHVGGTMAGNDSVNGGTSANDGHSKQARIAHLSPIPTPPGNDMTIPFNIITNQLRNPGLRPHTISNSWWTGDKGQYTNASVSTDLFCWKNRDVVLIKSCGNQYHSSQYQITEPGNAKSIIAAASVLNGTSSTQLSDFSSGGPAPDGRVKPDISVPGENIMSVQAGSSNGYVSMSGTSMSAPCTNGSVGLLRSYLRKGFYPSGAADPSDTLGYVSSALLRALVLVSADPNIGSWTIPNSYSGWGRLNLDSVLFFSTPTPDARKLLLYDDTIGLATGEYREFQFQVDTTIPLRAGVVWTDTPCAAGANPNLINNLNCQLTAPGGAFYRGCLYTSGQSTPNPSTWDNLNPLEMFRVNGPVAGNWVLRVTAQNVVTARKQPYAVVITGPVSVSSVDVGVRTIIAPAGPVDSGVAVTPRVIVHNFGNTVQTFGIKFTIADGYQDSITRTVGPGADSTYSFADWTALVRGRHLVKCSTRLAGDMVPANDRAIDSVDVIVHDVGTAAILAPSGTIDSGTTVIPRAIVTNFGAWPESFFARFTIGSFYTDSQPVSLTSGTSDTVGFAPWTAAQLGIHVTMCSTMLAADANPANDRCRDSVRVIPQSAVEEPLSVVPVSFVLGNPNPNPFGRQTAIAYALPHASRVDLRVYSANGRAVRTLRIGPQPAGRYTAAWHGTDESGNPVVRGVYYCRLVTDGLTAVRKLVKVE
jgi:hypothetical protein